MSSPRYLTGNNTEGLTEVGLMGESGGLGCGHTSTPCPNEFVQAGAQCDSPDDTSVGVMLSIGALPSGDVMLDERCHAERRMSSYVCKTEFG